MDDGDIMCRPILVLLPFLEDFDAANARVGAERNPLRTGVIYCVSDLDAAPPESNIGDVRRLPKTSAVTGGSTTLGVAVLGNSSQTSADVIRAVHERVQLCQDPQTEFALLRENLELAVSTTSFGFTATQSWRNTVL